MLQPPLGSDLYNVVSEINATLSALVLLSQCLGTVRDLEQYASKPFQDHKSVEPLLTYEDRSIADELAKNVRVLCWVLTQPSNHEKKARHVKATWGKRCNILLFMSTEADPNLPAINLPVPEGKEFLWAKTKAAFKYVYEHHRNDADWFMKADDDTYVIVENLRYMLSKHNSKDPIYFGCRFKPYVSEQGYMSGGAGYVLSREALDRFVNIGLTQKVCDSNDVGAEDINAGKCLYDVGVKAMDSRDSFGHGRFFPLRPHEHLLPDKEYPDWYWQYIYYPIDGGLNCCSTTAVSFHYVEPAQMYEYEYLIYKLRPYGVRYSVAFQTAGSFEPLTKTIGSNEPEEKTMGKNKTKVRTLDRNETTEKTVDNNETIAKTIDSNEIEEKSFSSNKVMLKTKDRNKSKEKIHSSNETKVKTNDFNGTNAISAGSNKTMAKIVNSYASKEKSISNYEILTKTINRNKTKVKSVSSNETLEKTVDSHDSKEKSVDSNETTAKTVGGNESKENSVGSNKTIAKTVGSNESKEKTVGSNETIAKTVGGNESKEKTVGSNKTIAKTVGSNESKEKTVGSNETIAKTVGSNESKEKTVGSNKTIAKTVGSNESKEKTVGSNKSEEKSVGSNETTAKTVANKEIKA